MSNPRQVWVLTRTTDSGTGVQGVYGTIEVAIVECAALQREQEIDFGEECTDPQQVRTAMFLYSRWEAEDGTEWTVAPFLVEG